MSVGCAGDSSESDASEFCHQLAEDYCDRFIGCYTAEDLVLMGLPTSVAECAVVISDRLSCDNPMESGLCASGDTFVPDLAPQCLGEIDAEQCDDIASLRGLAQPSCNAACTPMTPDDGSLPTVAELCTQQLAAYCHSVYACFSAELREQLGLPPTEAECVTLTVEVNECSIQTPYAACGIGRSYDQQAHALCIEQMRGATCEEFQSGDPPACGSVCLPI